MASTFSVNYCYSSIPLVCKMRNAYYNREYENLWLLQAIIFFFYNWGGAKFYCSFPSNPSWVKLSYPRIRRAPNILHLSI